MSYFMSNGAKVDQAAAGLGQVLAGRKRAFRDGIFSVDEHPAPYGRRLKAFQDGIFGMGAAGELDLGDESTLAQVKKILRYLGFQVPPDVIDDGQWDGHTNAAYSAWSAGKQAQVPATLSTREDDYVFPTGAGIYMLYLDGVAAAGENYADTYWPAVTAWAKETAGSGTVSKPSTGTRILGMKAATAGLIALGLVAVGVGVYVTKK